MQGVGPGSLLGGRYLVQRRVAQHSRFERWSAADQTLDREVVLLCFDADGPVAAPTLDAARRAAGVEDHRLVRVLDVGRDRSVAFVVEEPLRGARSLTAALSDGGLPAEEARRVVGETAAALETARARGLHHGVLTPRSVLRLDDGTVKVRGLATEAALLQNDDTPPEQATRADTVALAGIAYALLTGRWPLTGPDAGLEAAPRVVGGVAAPGEIAAGVPADLDLLTRTTLNEDGGPRTPGELVEQIAPWSPTPVSGAFRSADRDPRRRPGSRTEPMNRDAATGGVARDGGQTGRAVSRGEAARGAALTGATGTAAGAAAGSVGTGGGGASGSVGSTGRGPGIPRSVLGMDVRSRPGRGSGANGGPPDGSDDGFEGYEGSEDDDLDDDLDDDPPERSGARPAAVVGALAAGAAAGGAAVAKGIGSAIGAVGDRVGGMARGAADRAAERSATRAERRETEQWEDPFVVGEQVRLSDTLERTDEQLEPAIRLLPGVGQEPLDRDQSRLVLIIIAVFVLFAAGLGIWGLPKLSGIGVSSPSVPQVTKTVTASPSAPAAAPAPTSSAPAPPQPITIVGASQISTDGGVQANKSAAQAFDGNPDTIWRSAKWFATPQYGGYQGRELGLLLDLGSPVDVHQVAFTLRGAADVTVYVANKPTIGGATEIGKVSGQDGDVTVSVADGGAVKGNQVIIWFTTLGPDGEGHFRAQVAEARVS